MLFQNLHILQVFDLKLLSFPKNDLQCWFAMAEAVATTNDPGAYQ